MAQRRTAQFSVRVICHSFSPHLPQHRDMPHILQLPPEVFSTTASFLGAKQVFQLCSVCRTFNTAVLGWRNNAAHPLYDLLNRSGVYWFRPDGIFYTPSVMGPGAGYRVELCLDTELLSNHFSVDEDLHGLTSDSNMLGKLLHGRLHCSTVTVGRLIYRFGGRHVADGSDARLQSCFCVDPLKRTAWPLPPMSCKRSSLAAASVGSKIFIFGGYNGARELDTMEVFETRTASWLVWHHATHTWRHSEHCIDDRIAAATPPLAAARTLSMPFSVCEHSAVTVAERYVMLMGGCRHRGQEGEASTSSVWLFDTVTNTWESLRDMPSDRIHGCASYRCTNGNDDDVDVDDDSIESAMSSLKNRCHKVVLCGGKPLRVNPDDSPTLVLEWRGDGVQPLRNAVWVKDVPGAWLTLSITAVQYNCHDVTHPQRTPFRVVIGPNSLVLLRSNRNSVTSKLDEDNTKERWYRDPCQIRGAVFGVCSIE
jgi:hypothetical protein